MRNLFGKNLTTALLIVLALLFALNTAVVFGDALVHADDDVAVRYSWKHVANGVWHCTNGTYGGCDTPSSHSY